MAGAERHDGVEGETGRRRGQLRRLFVLLLALVPAILVLTLVPFIVFPGSRG